MATTSDYNTNYNPYQQQQLPHQMGIGNNINQGVGNLDFNPYGNQQPTFQLPQMDIVNGNINQGVGNLVFNPYANQQPTFQLPQMDIVNGNAQLDFDPYSEQQPPFQLPQMDIMKRNIQLDFDPYQPQLPPFQVSFNIPQIEHNTQNNSNQHHNESPATQQQNPNNIREQQNTQPPQNNNEQANNNKDNQPEENNSNKKEKKKDQEEIEDEDEKEEKKKNNILLWLLYLLLFLLALTAIILAIVYISKLFDKDKTNDLANNSSSSNPVNQNPAINKDTNIDDNLLLSKKDGKQTTLGEIVSEGNTTFNGSNNAKDVLNGDINLSEEAKRCILAENQTSTNVKIFEDLDGNGIYTEGIDNLLAEGSGFTVDGGLATLYDEYLNKINIKLGNNICAHSDTLGNFSSKDLNLMNKLSVKQDPITGKCYSILDGDINVDLNIGTNNVSGTLTSCDINIGNFNATNLDKNNFANTCMNKFLNDKNKMSSLNEEQKKLLNAWQKGRNITGVNSMLNFLQNNNNPSRENLNSQNNNLQL